MSRQLIRIAVSLFALFGLSLPAAADPRGNVEIRRWYRLQEAQIPQLDAAWKKQGKSAKERALLAWQHRKDARLQARRFMLAGGQTAEVELVQKRDLEKYGDKDGPSFQLLVEKATRAAKKKAPDDAVYESIIHSAQTTNPLVNAWVKTVEFCHWAWNGFKDETQACALPRK